MDQYRIFFSSQLGNWQLLGSAADLMIAQQVTQQVAGGRFFANEDVLAVVLLQGSLPALYKPAWFRRTAARAPKLAVDSPTVVKRFSLPG